MALQTYFRATTNFTYDTRVAPSRSDDAVWDFLQSTQRVLRPVRHRRWR